MKYVIAPDTADAEMLRAEAATMREALNRIEGQAVCVNMDGPEGNERMLVDIAEMAHQALAEQAPPKVSAEISAAWKISEETLEQIDKMDRSNAESATRGQSIIIGSEPQGDAP